MNVIPPPPAGVNGAGRVDEQDEGARRDAEVHAAVADGLLDQIRGLLRAEGVVEGEGEEDEEYLLTAGEAAVVRVVAACGEAQLSLCARVAELTVVIAAALEERGAAAPDRDLLEAFMRGPRG